MKIENIKINSFGKLKDKEINLSKGINLIYGKNEAGKSTLLKFIENMFYGTSKNKKGRIFSDYDLYKPWDGDEFSGKIKYKLDSGESFEVFREFGKKNPKIYNENLEDISKKFNIDKNTGNEFFYEQTKVDEFMFLSSVVSMQQEVKLNIQDQNVYIQKIANLASTGDDTISFKKAMDKLNKKQLEEIGTDRTSGRPINIIKNKINLCENKVQELIKYKEEKNEIEKKQKILEKEIQYNKNKNNFIKELQEIKQNEKLENEKINLNKKIKEKNEEQINLMEKEKKEIITENKNNKNEINNNKKINITPYIIFAFIFMIIGVIGFIKFKNNLALITIIPIIIDFIIFKKKKNKINKKILHQKEKENKIKNQLNEKIKLINNKIEIIQKNNVELNDEINNLINKLELNINLKKEQLKTKYLYKMNNEDLNYLLQFNELNNELNKNEQIINKQEINLNLIKLEKEKIINNLEDLINFEEELESLKQEYEDLINKNNIINKAREFLQIAYEKMKNNVTPKFTANLSSNIEKISNGKYNKVSVNDEKGMIVEIPSGEYVSAEKLSAGTIEQLYLSLRLSMVKEISEETMPIILDEAFAYYDDERLENTLKFIAQTFNGNQILLFTCSHREEEILNRIDKEYQLIELNS